MWSRAVRGVLGEWRALPQLMRSSRQARECAVARGELARMWPGRAVDVLTTLRWRGGYWPWIRHVWAPLIYTDRPEKCCCSFVVDPNGCCPLCPVPLCRDPAAWCPGVAAPSLLAALARRVSAR